MCLSTDYPFSTSVSTLTKPDTEDTGPVQGAVAQVQTLSTKGVSQRPTLSPAPLIDRLPELVALRQPLAMHQDSPPAPDVECSAGQGPTTKFIPLGFSQRPTRMTLVSTLSTGHEHTTEGTESRKGFELTPTAQSALRAIPAMSSPDN